MPSAHAIGMLEPSELNDPVTFRYEMRTGWGLFTFSLSFDIRIDLDDGAYYGTIGAAIWNAAIATAICRTVNLDLVWLYRWRGTGAPFPYVPAGINRGHRGGTPANKARSAHVIMHTGHSDDLAARRLVLPQTPLSWQTDGMLNDGGWDALMEFAFGFKMGTAAFDIGGDLQHLIAYPGIVPVSIDNLSGTLLRPVTHLKVLQYTDKAPDWDGGVLG
jgi:hypothetical protein